MKRTVLGLIAVVSIALAGCGSSGGSGGTAAATPSSDSGASVDLSTVQGVSTPTSVQVVTANP